MTATPPVPVSALRWRGIVEGFYGPPWTTEQRRDQLHFAAGCGLNLYLLAPKDDPFHRARWREPYPAPAAADLGQLGAEAAALGIRFVVGIAPGLDWSPGDERALAGKVAALGRAGVEHVGLLFDDLPGCDPAADADLGRRHGRLAALVGGDPLLVCPSDYAGVAPTPYRRGLAETLPGEALVLWSGPDVVSGRVSAEDVEPWRRAGHDLAGAALTACDRLAGAPVDRAALRAQVAAAEAHWPNVLRDVHSPYVRAVLGPGPDDPGSPYASIVAAGEPTAGEERLAQLLRRRGLACRRRLDPDEPPALVVVSRSADERASPWSGCSASSHSGWRRPAACCCASSGW